MDLLNQYYGVFLQTEFFPYALGGTIFLVLAFGYVGVPFLAWSALLLVAMFGFHASPLAIEITVALLVVFNLKPIRRMLVSSAVMKLMKALRLIPKISATERTALEAGVVWMESELFSGKPNLKRLMDQPYPKLTPEEQSFLDNEVEELCSMIDDWQFWKTKQLPDEVFDFIKKKGFLGMIIPKEYGGKNFSAACHSAVIQKISSRSVAGAIYVMVPNSLGPAELLNHYGTAEQKRKYLPRLADGSEIPCFGLTEPTAGSDAGSITSEGVLFKGDDGKIYIRLNWNKRWITLASIATILGLAFRLRDPDNLLGKGPDLGITCALIPSNLPGITLGQRHDPMGVPFHNCPMQGKDVVVNAEEAIIGGLARAGQGWQMLMESLGAGRGISLPAQAVGGSKLVSRVTSNHSVIRKQFGLSIGKFEGIEEPLARIGGSTYLLEALRSYVLSALDQKISPPICTAITKYSATEIARKVVCDGMDIMGGAGISMGPRNTIATGYIGIPISITVEGANILTRTLMVFGQGALRAHPYAFKEVNAVEKNDLKAFDEAFWGHIGHIARNKTRAVLLSLTRGHLIHTPAGGPVKRYYQKLAWTSASFAFMADLAMGLLGGKLKVKEKLTGRFADILSWMFIGTAVLRRWEADGRPEKDLPFVHYSMTLAFNNIQEAFDGIFSNLDVPVLGWIFRGPVRWWARFNFLALPPTDRLTKQVAETLLNEQESRDRLTAGIFMPTDPAESLARLEKAYVVIKKAAGVEKKIRLAIKSKKIPKKPNQAALLEAVKQGILTQEEFSILDEAEKLRLDAIQVDSFTEEEYLPGDSANKKAQNKTASRFTANA